MSNEEYLERFGKVERPQKHKLEDQILRFDISDRREVRPSTFMEKLKKNGLIRLFPTKGQLS